MTGRSVDNNDRDVDPIGDALLGVADPGDASLKPAASEGREANVPQGRARALLDSLRSKEGLARNVLLMLLWQGANYLAPLLTFPHLARTLHPTNFGKFGLYLLIAGWMTIVSDWGTNMTGARAIAQARARTGEIDEPFWNIFLLRFAIVMVVLFLAVGYLTVTEASREEWLLLLSAWSMILGNALTVSWCLQGLERLDAFASAALVGRLATVPATILLVRTADQVWLAVALQGLGGILIGLTSMLILYRSRRITRFSANLSGMVREMRNGFPVLSTTVSHGLYSSTATLTLGWLHGPAATGVFVAADRIRMAAQNVVQPVGQAIFPRVSRLVVTDRDAAVRLIHALAKIQGAVMAFGCIALIVLSPYVVGFLAGPAFSASVPVLCILAPTIAVYATNNVLGRQTLMPFGYDKVFGRIGVTTAVVNVLIMPPLVYFFSANGAATGVLVTESFILICCVTVIWRERILSLRRDSDNGEGAAPAAPQGG
jgi:O-antigen/teichoic acid export membrane protein